MTRCHWCQKRASTTDNGGHPLCSKKCKLVPLSERPAKAKRRTTANRKVSLPAPRSSSFIIPDSPLGTILKNIPTAGPRGGGSRGRWDGFIRLLKLGAGENDALDQFVAHWDGLPATKRMKIAAEDILHEIDVAPAHFIGVLAETMYALGRDQSKLIAAVSEPLVVGVMTKQAMTTEGFNDRKLFLTSTGYAPSPQTSISVAQDNRSVVAVQQQAPGLPDMSADALRFSEIVSGNGPKQISPSSFVLSDSSGQSES